MPPKELSLHLWPGKMRACWPLAPVDTGPPRFRGASDGKLEGEPLSERRLREIGRQLG